MIDPQVLFDKLAGFQDAEEIATYFRQEGITGKPAVANSCPIANYYRTHGHKMLGITQFSTNIYNGFNGERFQNTEAMEEFVVLFDGGGFPELRAKGE